ncbi:MAG: hypothetical protein WBC59_07030 [Phycisphaerae bacterium]
MTLLTSANVTLLNERGTNLARLPLILLGSRLQYLSDDGSYEGAATLKVGTFGKSGVSTGAIVFSDDLDVYEDGQLDIISGFGASTSDLTSADSAKVGRFRHIVTGTALTVAHETYGLMGQLVVKGTTLTHMHAGLIGTLEGHTAGAVANGAYDYSVAAIIARVGGGAAIVATKPIAGVASILNGADVATGSIAAFAASATSTGQWTWGLALGDCDEAFNFLTTGACVSAHSVGTITSGKQILVSIDGSPYAMAVYAVGTG